jgi:hypothetical protein
MMFLLGCTISASSDEGQSGKEETTKLSFFLLAGILHVAQVALFFFAAATAAQRDTSERGKE